MSNTASNSRRSKLQKNVTNINKYFKKYCTSTSIHGFKYFGEDRSTFEKIWWIIIFILCLCGCSAMIYKIWEKYESSPIIVTFATAEIPINEIPFPSVTICPEVKADNTKLNLTEIYYKQHRGEILTDRETKYLEYMSLICEENDFFITENRSDHFTNDIFSDLNKVKPEFLIGSCKIFSWNCSPSIFVPVITDEGVCYSMNLLDIEHIFQDRVYRFEDFAKLPSAEPEVDNDNFEENNEKMKNQHVKDNALKWDIERGYYNKSQLTAYPRRALFSGATNGLTIILATLHQDVNFICKSVQGYKVVLHSPIRIPRLKQDYFRLSLDETVVASVRPAMIKTSDAIKGYRIEKRDCLFQSDKKLTYFKIYSQQNCILECLANLTLDLCGCVEYFMPRDNDTKICGVSNSIRQCVKMAEDLLQLQELSQKFKDAQILDFEDLCSCLPTCSDINYMVDTSQTKWDWKQSIESSKLMFPDIDLELIHLSKLTVYFKVNHFIYSERQELYGFSDFVASFGGLIGLFTGFSILSLMEIIYFLTVRICCNVRLFKNWTGDSGLQQT